MTFNEPFYQALKRAYLDAPAQVLPNALWKTLEPIKDSLALFTVDLDGQPAQRILVPYRGPGKPIWGSRQPD